MDFNVIEYLSKRYLILNTAYPHVSVRANSHKLLQHLRLISGLLNDMFSMGFSCHLFLRKYEEIKIYCILRIKL